MKDILVVEDGTYERERLLKLFSTNGYAVIAVESVGEAEQILAQESFRLAILDIGLSDRSGSYLFSFIKRTHTVNEIIIFTGNPSQHLKQRFIEEGAADYIVKASPQSQNEMFLSRVKEILGEPFHTVLDGVNLKDFLDKYISSASSQFFFDMDDNFPKCSGCGAKDYIVTFSHQTQMPPEIIGLVVCGKCGKTMDPDIE